MGFHEPTVATDCRLGVRQKRPQIGDRIEHVGGASSGEGVAVAFSREHSGDHSGPGPEPRADVGLGVAPLPRS